MSETGFSFEGEFAVHFFYHGVDAENKKCDIDLRMTDPVMEVAESDCP